MPLSTRKSNANAHPGVPDKPQPRRSSQQVQLDKSRAKAAAAAAREQRETDRRAVLSSIAHLEDSMERAEEERRLHSMRPDLWPNAHPYNQEEGNGSDESAKGGG